LFAAIPFRSKRPFQASVCSRFEKGCSEKALKKERRGIALSARLIGSLVIVDVCKVLLLVKDHKRARLELVPSYWSSSGRSFLILRQPLSKGRATSESDTSAKYLSFCLCTAPQDWSLWFE
jgi:hypothetical protein